MVSFYRQTENYIEQNHLRLICLLVHTFHFWMGGVNILMTQNIISQSFSGFHAGWCHLLSRNTSFIGLIPLVLPIALSTIITIFPKFLWDALVYKLFNLIHFLQSLKHPPGVHVELIAIYKGRRNSEPFQTDCKKSAIANINSQKANGSSTWCMWQLTSMQRWNWNGLKWGLVRHQGWRTKSSLCLLNLAY